MYTYKHTKITTITKNGVTTRTEEVNESDVVPDEVLKESEGFDEIWSSLDKAFESIGLAFKKLFK